MTSGSSGQTAAEVVHGRVDAGKQNLGMTTWLGGEGSPGIPPDLA
jgi:hypothetical protein